MQTLAPNDVIRVRWQSSYHGYLGSILYKGRMFVQYLKKKKKKEKDLSKDTAFTKWDGKTKK